jgi:hypothetical protein
MPPHSKLPACLPIVVCFFVVAWCISHEASSFAMRSSLTAFADFLILPSLTLVQFPDLLRRRVFAVPLDQKQERTCLCSTPDSS